MKNSVRECREELRITQQDLANRVGVSRQSIISIEKGKYDPSLALAFKLSAVLERGIEELFIPSPELT
ncbi:helix-turn-helix transcriptional regulator [Arthrobacter cryoconiti]|uniref:Helix-turn-helix transcriptional regulator n=1 Tax=Arthrobacter cryoconiti TaxID=748907 RepID=A0ABV8R220_9MICC|nr:helix-turn-helix transcriptional regulator [Arthrobacter cryoconiti]MCC9068103.1 helix-turn-helix transcriptional regulator [Arthrobacter cryoconiti]